MPEFVSKSFKFGVDNAFGPFCGSVPFGWSSREELDDIEVRKLNKLKEVN